MDRHSDRAEAVRKAVLESEATVDRKVREACANNQDVPENLRAYVDKVARHAYKVTDEDVEALKKAGYSQDQIFEITISAALGASLKRLNIGLAALKGGK
jgi:hypothetical protein